MNDSWTFGWTQLLMIAGLALTGLVSILGLRTFGKWRRETIEERRIEAAVNALSLAYQAEWIFENIRAPIVYPYEYEEMPKRPGEPEERRESRGKYYAVLKRLERNGDFFKGVWSVQPRVMALFGAEAERIFRELHEARRQIEVSAGLLYRDFTSEVGLELTDDTKGLRRQQREDIDWAEASGAEDGDRIAAKLTVFLTVWKCCVAPSSSVAIDNSCTRHRLPRAPQKWSCRLNELSRSDFVLWSTPAAWRCWRRCAEPRRA